MSSRWTVFLLCLQLLYAVSRKDDTGRQSREGFVEVAASELSPNKVKGWLG